MTKVEEMGPLVILQAGSAQQRREGRRREATHQNLPPFSTQSPESFFFAVVRIDTTSLPAPGSDMASEPTLVPASSSGRYLAFCALVPCRAIWLMQRLECAPYERPTEAEAREISEMRAQAKGAKRQ
jgi:hypothetical protein